MGIIKKLDPIIANKIAAGEVIEKLANVVKELVENSIDAKAKHIDVDLKASGLKMIQVIDDGEGMDQADILQAFERHATSKIASVNDLFRIQSLGFRGEAIPSIASIAKVSITSNQDGQAKEVVYDNGRLVKEDDASFNQGTKVLVEKIFHYTPARFKYLKSEHYELALIQRLIYQFALAYPNLSFRLTNDQKLLFSSSGDGDVRQLMAQIYGTDVGRALMTFTGHNRDYHIHGWTSKAVVNRSNKQYMHIIVNHRVIQDPKIERAILESYEQMIPKQRYPITVLYIDVDPILIDVNVHPRKQEIKFSEKDQLLDLIHSTLSDMLQAKPIYQDAPKKIKQTSLDFTDEKVDKRSLIEEEEIVKTKKDDTPMTNQSPLLPDMAYIGQYGGTYLLFQNQEGLWMVDQHAAAERIRYERYLKEMTANNQYIQTTIFPLKIDLPSDVLTSIQDQIDIFQSIGVQAFVKTNHLLVKEVPQWFPKGFEDQYIEAIIDFLLEEKIPSKAKLIDELAILLACKHSLKANHYINQREASHLIKDLRQCQRPYTCPHGRPIIVKIKQSQIEHWFNRVI